jgi:hypothetical protein
MNTKRTPINKRALISFLLLIALAFLISSGLPLHFAAFSRNWTNYHVLMTIHNTSALIFFVAALIHVFLNMRLIKSYLVQKVSASLNARRELAIAVVVVLGMVVITTLHVFHGH